MPARTKPQLIEYARERYGVTVGCYVSWQPPYKHINRRFGCVLSFDDVERDGCCVVQASNAKLRVPIVVLRPEHDCTDCITADQRGIYSKVEA